MCRADVRMAQVPASCAALVPAYNKSCNGERSTLKCLDPATTRHKSLTALIWRHGGFLLVEYRGFSPGSSEPRTAEDVARVKGEGQLRNAVCLDAWGFRFRAVGLCWGFGSKSIEALTLS